MNVHDTRGAEPVLGRQGTCDEVQTVHEPGTQLLAKAGDTLRQQYIVDPILQVGVFASQVQASIGRRILRRAGCVQEHLVDRGILASRQCLDLRLIDSIHGCAQLRDDLFSGHIQFPHDRCGGQRDDVCATAGIGS